MLFKPRSEFGKYLAQNGISQKWLARQTGISEGTISQLAHGKQSPSLPTARKIIRVLRQFDLEISSEDFW